MVAIHTAVPIDVREDLDELVAVYSKDRHPMPGHHIVYDMTTWRVHTVAWANYGQALVATAAPI